MSNTWLWQQGLSPCTPHPTPANVPLAPDSSEPNLPFSGIIPEPFKLLEDPEGIPHSSDLAAVVTLMFLL